MLGIPEVVVRLARLPDVRSTLPDLVVWPNAVPLPLELMLRLERSVVTLELVGVAVPLVSEPEASLMALRATRRPLSMSSSSSVQGP